MTARTLHCANQGLYLGATLLILGLCTYTALQAQDTTRLALSTAAALLCLAWGGYYATLSYSITPAGITRRVFFCRRTHIAWEQLAHVEQRRLCTPETTSLTLIFHAQDGTTLTLSSDLLPLEAMEQLAEDAKSVGFLKNQE